MTHHDDKSENDFGRAYGRPPYSSGGGAIKWLYTWVLTTLAGMLILWIIMRLTVGATRGDTGPALVATIGGVIFGVIFTFLVYRRRK